jgi:hypothetical protein
VGELLKQVSKECGSEDIRTQLRRLGSVFLNHREISAQETVYRILSLPLKQLSRKVIFVNTDAKEERVSLLKPINHIQHMDEDSEDIYQTSLIDMLQDQIISIICALLSLLPTTPLAVDKNSQKMRQLTHCQQLRMERVVDVKASSSRVALDACTSAGGKPSFAYIDSTTRRN